MTLELPPASVPDEATAVIHGELPHVIELQTYGKSPSITGLSDPSGGGTTTLASVLLKVPPRDADRGSDRVVTSTAKVCTFTLPS